MPSTEAIASTPEQNVAGPQLVAAALSLPEVTELFIKHYGLHEGQFDLVVQFQIGVGGVQLPPDTTPQIGAVVAVTKLGLTKALQPGPRTVDASKVNPPQAAKKLAKARKT